MDVSSTLRNALHVNLSNEGDQAGFWVRKISWRREWLLTPIFLPGEFHGLYSPWGHRELDTTERFSLSFSHVEIIILNVVK